MGGDKREEGEKKVVGRWRIWILGKIKCLVTTRLSSGPCVKGVAAGLHKSKIRKVKKIKQERPMRRCAVEKNFLL